MKKEEVFRIFLGIVTFGCIWGFLEAITFGGLLHSHWGDLFPYHLCPCFIMAATFGSFVMGSALAIYKKPAMLIGIGLVAAVFCWLGVPFLPTSVRSAHYGPVISSATAAIMGSISLALVAGFSMKRLEGNILTCIGVGALSALLASILFILSTAYGLDKPICADLGYARPLPDFLAIGGVVWMLAAAISLPLGYLTGMKLQSRFAPVFTRRPSFNYITSTVTIIFCCGVGMVAFMIGL
ncbi:MAG TPA: hypothetical protein DDW17_03165 [Deltaproteobacteria bacterium]|nr:hypothetical protein [Deltaproteobacteria bacterium]